MIKDWIMNLKRIFGIILTVLGIGGLIYAAAIFMDASGTEKQIKVLAVYFLLVNKALISVSVRALV